MLNLLFVLLMSTGAINRSDSVVSPQEYFGDSYSDALNFCLDNRDGFRQFYAEHGVDPALACAVIFPELIRYNRFRDFMETSALEMAYTTGGKGIADFSIGRFQMKPSFVEMLEDELAGWPELMAEFNEVVYYTPKSSIQQIRSERIARLKMQLWQNIYLACFIKLASEKFKEEIGRNPEELLLILSSAYNLGLRADYVSIKRIAGTKTFPYGNSFTGRFSYYDVADYFYTNHSTKILSEP